MANDSTGLRRRQLLCSAAMAGLAGCPSDTDGGTVSTDGGSPTDSQSGPRLDEVPQAEPTGSHAPGPPVFTSVGEAIRAPEFDGVESDLAPWNPGREGNYEWAVADAPPESEATVGDAAAVEFRPDVPGTYRLPLSAPDGTHELTVRAFPESTAGEPRPTLTLRSELTDDDAIVRADASPPPASGQRADDLDVEFLVDDRDRGALDGKPARNGRELRIAREALAGPIRVHAVAVGDTGRSVADTVRIEPTAETVAHPTEPPAWAEDAVVYEIFVRRFGADADFAFLESKVDYLDEMGADAVWLTPILDAHSHRDETQPGGPHGYDVIDYFATADALGTREAFESFVDACHERGIKVIFDLVVNHTAREHRYFRAAAADESSPFRDWYVWEDGEPQFYFGWEGIPILNFDEPAVRSWVLAVAEEWAEVVDGFRCDVAWGVPHSFWKEFRARIKREYPEFLLLGEAVPWEADYADFAENEFGLHYGEGLFETLQSIGEGSAPADALHDVLDRRRSAGYPDHVAMLNYAENHDTDRYLAVGDRASQPAAGAATFTLPGAPMLYYGQETGLTERREPMNWDTADEELRTFYRDLADVRHSEPALQSAADVVPLAVAPGNDRVTGYARELEGERVHVLLNFGPEPAAVAVDAGVETRDRVTGRDVGTGDGRVTVENCVVLRADPLAGRGEQIAAFDETVGDDHGPGGVAYPDGIPADTLDLAGLDVYERGDTSQFVWEFAAPVADGGLGRRHLQLYLREPTGGDGGTTRLREGVNCSVESPYQHRAVVTPETAVLEDDGGRHVADLSVSVSGRRVRVDVPADAMPAEPRETELFALVAAYDSDAPGGVAPLETDGANVLDVVTPPLTTQAEVLRPSAEGVVAPYVSLADGVRNLRLDAELLAEWDDPVGDDHGPGGYTYPDSDRWPDGTLDLTRFAVFEGNGRYHCQFQFREPVDGGSAGGLSQHVQLYVRDPDADGGTTAAREGVNADFAEPYHYRVVADGSTAAVEDASGAVVSDAVTVETRAELPGVWVTVPRDAVGDPTATALVPLVLGSSITGTGGVAQIAAERSVTDFGGRERETQPNVVDLLTPDGVTQAEALADTDGVATIPFVKFASGR